jgi:hypothetical protein
MNDMRSDGVRWELIGFVFLFCPLPHDFCYFGLDLLFCGGLRSFFS